MATYEFWEIRAKLRQEAFKNQAVFGRKIFRKFLVIFALHPVGLEQATHDPIRVKAVVGIHLLPTRSLFGGDIPRNLLLRVSLAKPTSAPWRF
jgi:hypothetical protein